MSLDPVRSVVLAQARAEADSLLESARREAAARRSEAEAQAAELVRLAGEERVEAARVARARRLALAERQAHARILGARRQAYDELRERVHAAAGDIRRGPAYEELRERLAAAARDQLGADAVLSEAPGGGLEARAGSRLVDYSLPAMVERCLSRLGPGLEELWQPLSGSGERAGEGVPGEGHLT